MATVSKTRPAARPAASVAPAAAAPKKSGMSEETKARLRAAKKTKKAGVCIWSGEPTGGGLFRPGNDAKLKSLLLRIKRGEAKLSEIPQAVIPYLRREGGVVGFKLDGKELSVVGNFTVGAGKAARKAKTKAAPVVAAADDDEEEEEFFEEDEDE